MAVVAVVMAGGRGERFWPASREGKPKQFLAFDSQGSLLQRTVKRIAGLAPNLSTWVVTRKDYAALVYAQLPDIPPQRVVLEPEGRDTAACVALAALCVAQQDPEAVLVMLPADHLVIQEARFREVLQHAVRVAREGDYLVTLGMKPTRPETAYGYIEVGGPFDGDSARMAHHVSSFREKPDRDTAMKYLQSGQYLWNSGIFVWRASTIKKALHRHLPQLMSLLEPLESVMGTGAEAEVLNRVYPLLPRTSIDYGVMERADNVLVLPSEFGWDDLGTWSAVERLTPPDSAGNVTSGQVITVETTSSIVRNLAPDRLVVAFGISDLVVVDTEDAVLVAHKSRVSDMKAVVGRIQRAGFEQFLQLPSNGNKA